MANYKELREQAVKAIAALNYRDIAHFWNHDVDVDWLKERFDGDLLEYLSKGVDWQEEKSILKDVERIRPHLGPVDSVTVSWLYEQIIEKPLDLPMFQTRAEAAAWLNGNDPLDILKAYGMFGGITHEGILDTVDVGRRLYEIFGEKVYQTPKDLEPKVTQLSLDMHEFILENLDLLISRSKDAHIQRLEATLAEMEAAREVAPKASNERRRA